jgi:hypothetical protein
MTTTTEAAADTCPFGWCVYGHPGHHQHAWTDGVPAKVEGKPGRVYTYAGLYDGAEYLRDALTQVIKYARREQR